jgi:hypothetical protein
MEDLTLPSVGASFKIWGCCTPILPKCQEVPYNSKKQKKNNFFEKTDVAHNILKLVLGRPSEKESKTTVIPKIW